MMRVISIVAIAASLLFIVVSFAYIHMVDSDRSAASYELINSYSSDSDYQSDSMYESYRSSAADNTRAGGIFSLIMLAVLEAAYVLSLAKIKTKTMKVLSIIGMSLTGIMMFVSFAPIGSPSGCSFDEIGILFTLMGVIGLVFFIIGTIHAFRVKA